MLYELYLNKAVKIYIYTKAQDPKLRRKTEELDHQSKIHGQHVRKNQEQGKPLNPKI